MAKVKLGDFEVKLNGELPEVGSQLPDFLLACLLYTSPSPRDS